MTHLLCVLNANQRQSLQDSVASVFLLALLEVIRRLIVAGNVVIHGNQERDKLLTADGHTTIRCFFNTKHDGFFRRFQSGDYVRQNMLQSK